MQSAGSLSFPVVLRSVRRDLRQKTFGTMVALLCPEYLNPLICCNLLNLCFRNAGKRIVWHQLCTLGDLET